MPIIRCICIFYSLLTPLCVIKQMTVAELEDKVKEHECYNSELQDVEKWLLQMSSRLVTSDLMESSNLETITQQLANHKVGFSAMNGTLNISLKSDIVPFLVHF